MKNIIFILLVTVTNVSQSEVILDLPNNLKMIGTVIYDGEIKAGEVTSKASWPYSNGTDFTESFKVGFVDDPVSTVFMDHGEENGFFWICRKSEYWGGKGNSGTWYSRRFWVNGPILTLYSYDSCDHNLSEALNIAKTLKEK